MEMGSEKFFSDHREALLSSSSSSPRGRVYWAVILSENMIPLLQVSRELLEQPSRNVASALVSRVSANLRDRRGICRNKRLGGLFLDF